MSILEMQVDALMRLCLAEQEPERQRAKQELILICIKNKTTSIPVR